MSEEEWNRLRHSLHDRDGGYNQPDQLHGLGLLIVRQVTANHNGTFQINPSTYGGFKAVISLPMV